MSWDLKSLWCLDMYVYITNSTSCLLPALPPCVHNESLWTLFLYVSNGKMNHIYIIEWYHSSRKKIHFPWILKLWPIQSQRGSTTYRSTSGSNRWEQWTLPQLQSRLQFTFTSSDVAVLGKKIVTSLPLISLGWIFSQERSVVNGAYRIESMIRNMRKAKENTNHEFVIFCRSGECSWDTQKAFFSLLSFPYTRRENEKVAK